MGYPINTKVPCFNCSNRSMTCHAECEQYLLYKREHESQCQTIRKQKEKEEIINGMVFDGMKRSTRSRHGIVGQR
jgi:hypothetical protein